VTVQRFTGEYMIPGAAPKWIERHHVARYRFAAGYVRGKRVLDIACGVGYGSRMLLAAGALRVDGVDISEDVVEYARGQYAADGLTFSCGDITTFSSEDPYDVITCFETIEHIPDHRAALRNLLSLQPAGGTLIISSPNRLIVSPKAGMISDRPANRYHIREFTMEELENELIGAGYEVPDGSLYGQNHQRYFGSELANRIYRRIVRPHKTTSADVTPVRNMMPRYFVITAHKPAT